MENIKRREYIKCLNDPKINLPVGESHVTERRRFRHQLEHILATPITGGGIVTTVVQSLLNARPYLELAKAPL